MFAIIQSKIASREEVTGSEALLTESEEFLIGLANLLYSSGDLQQNFSKLQM